MNDIIKYTILFLSVTLLVSCNFKGKQQSEEKESTAGSVQAERNKEAREDSLKLAEAYVLQAKFTNTITAAYETTPVKSNLGDDAADDPAIWVNKSNPEKSIIIGTNKKAGINVYDLKGNELQFIEIGKVNNADVSYGFLFAGKTIDIVAASNRTNQAVEVLAIDGENQKLVEKPLITIPSSVDDVYGLCMFHDTENNKHYVFVNGKNGKVEQWWLNNLTDTLTAELARSFWVSSQPEGMVVDHQTNTLFVGVEEDAIYKFSAFADADTSSLKIDSSSSTRNPNISYDIEGLSIYRTSENKGYLIASIQGNFSYAVFDLTDDNNYITSFSIKDGQVDGVEETDGIAVTTSALGEEFPKGILVVQDGYNKDGDIDANQNFKIVSFEEILKFLE